MPRVHVIPRLACLALLVSGCPAVPLEVDVVMSAVADVAAAVEVEIEVDVAGATMPVSD